MSLFLDVAARFTALGIVIATVIVIISYGKRTAAAKYALWFCAVGIALLVTHGPKPMVIRGEIGFLLLMIANYIFVLAWRFGLEVFDEFDNNQVLWWLALGLQNLFTAVMVTKRYDLIDYTDVSLRPLILLQLYSMLALMAHLAWRAYRGQENDLVETRRRYRSRFSLGFSTSLFVILFIDEVSHVHDPMAGYYLRLITPLVAIVVLAWALKIYPLTLSAKTASLAVKPKKTPAASDALTAQLHKQLQRQMSENKVYREHGLTVVQLAERMNCSEKQLRNLINQTLGYRNFANYLNSFRLAEAKQSLADDSKQQLPILSIALEVGFASISPFNAAFKVETGVTPSQYRKKHSNSIT